MKKKFYNIQILIWKINNASDFESWFLQHVTFLFEIFSMCQILEKISKMCQLIRKNLHSKIVFSPIFTAVREKLAFSCFFKKQFSDQKSLELVRFSIGNFFLCQFLSHESYSVSEFESTFYLNVGFWIDYFTMC